MKLLIILFAILYSCSPQKKGGDIVPLDLTFEKPSAVFSEGNTTFKLKVKTEEPIYAILLWVKSDTEFELLDTLALNKVDNVELIKNGSFENYNNTMIGETASYFNAAESLNANMETSSDVGVLNLSQMINVISPGNMGIALAQQINLSQYETYECLLYYKTENSKEIYAEIAQNELSQTSISKILPGTNDKWVERLMYFNITEDFGNPMIRFKKTTSGKFWLDELSLKKVVEKSKIKDYSYSSIQNISSKNFEWYLEIILPSSTLKSPIYSN